MTKDETDQPNSAIFAFSWLGLFSLISNFCETRAWSCPPLIRILRRFKRVLESDSELEVKKMGWNVAVASPNFLSPLSPSDLYTPHLELFSNSSK